MPALLLVALVSRYAAAAGDPAEMPGAAASAAGLSSPAPLSGLPMLVGAQYTFVSQAQSSLTSPYRGMFSLNPKGDHETTHTIGLYLGWAPLTWWQWYFDTEKFMGAGVSGATGLGGLTNGDVLRQGVAGLKKEFYIARLYARFMLPLGSRVVTVARGQDQIPGTESTTRLELKVGRLALSDDIDKNRYAGTTRTQFMNTSLWQNTAWDYAANTRGYSDGFVLGYIRPEWTLKYAVFRMPLYANGQTLETLARARGENLELTLTPPALSTIARLLAYRNTARMGDYREALAIAATTITGPNVAATDREGRHKYGFGVNVEQPLADEGETGLFVRLGWNDGRTEDFAFAEVDQDVSFGGQLAGTHWRRADDRLGAGVVIEGLSAPHRDYLAAGGRGFVLGDGRLNYASEQIFETYYRAQWAWAPWGAAVRAQLGPDFQYIRNPGFNRDRGPVHFYSLRLHLEY
jgi:high affinity Mn2+ porin